LAQNEVHSPVFVADVTEDEDRSQTEPEEIIIEYERADLAAFALRNNYDDFEEYNSFHSKSFHKFHTELIEKRGYKLNDKTVSFSFIVKDDVDAEQNSVLNAYNAGGKGSGALSGPGTGTGTGAGTTTTTTTTTTAAGNSGGSGAGTTPSPVPKWHRLPTGLECFTKYKYGGNSLLGLGDHWGSGFMAEIDCYNDRENKQAEPEHQMTGCSTIVDTPYFNSDPVYRSGEQIFFANKKVVYPICSAYHADGQAIGISARCCRTTETNYDFRVEPTPFTYDWNTYCFNTSCGSTSLLKNGRHMGCTGWVGTEDVGKWSNAFIGNKNHDENGCLTTRNDAEQIVSTQALCGKISKLTKRPTPSPTHGQPTKNPIDGTNKISVVCYDEEAETSEYNDQFGYWESTATCKYGWDTVDCNSYIDIAIDQCAASPMIHYGNNYGGYMVYYQQQTPVDGITAGINLCKARGDTEYIRAQANCCKLGVENPITDYDDELEEDLDDDLDEELYEEFVALGGPNLGSPRGGRQ